MTLTAKDLAKTEGVLTANPDDSLASALAKMHSSHDAVFVSQGERLLGIVSAYQTLFRGHKPAGTKVKNCLFLAPKLKPETRVEQIARLMLEAKLYFLPVVTNTGKWLGIVSYRRLLRLNQNLDLKAKSRPLITASDSLTVGQARGEMKKSGVSRLVVVNPNGRLIGILTRYDLNRALKNPLMSRPVKPFIQRNVVTAGRHTPANQLITLMLDKRIGSVVLTDNQYRPVGLVSVRDCLEALAKPAGQETRVTFQFPQNFRFGQTVVELVNRWRSGLKHLPLLRFDIKLNAHSNAANLPSGYKVSLQAQPAHQKPVVARGSGRDWKLAVRKGLERLKRQLGRR